MCCSPKSLFFSVLFTYFLCYSVLLLTNVVNAYVLGVRQEVSFIELTQSILRPLSKGKREVGFYNLFGICILFGLPYSSFLFLKFLYKLFFYVIWTCFFSLLFIDTTFKPWIICSFIYVNYIYSCDVIVIILRNEHHNPCSKPEQSCLNFTWYKYSSEKYASKYSIFSFIFVAGPINIPIPQTLEI